MTEPKTNLEKIFGNPLTEAAGAALALFFPIAAPLPALTNRFAAGRFAQRIENALAKVSAGLLALGEKIGKFTDDQCSLTAGIIQTICETIDEEKLRMLTAAALNVANSDYIESFQAEFLKRVLRSISAAEVAFLSKHRNFAWFSFASPRGEESTYYVDSRTIEGPLARGLINLGLLVRSNDEGTAGDNGAYLIHVLAKRLLDLIEGGEHPADGRDHTSPGWESNL